MGYRHIAPPTIEAVVSDLTNSCDLARVIAERHGVCRASVTNLAKRLKIARPDNYEPRSSKHRIDQHPLSISLWKRNRIIFELQNCHDTYRAISRRCDASCSTVWSLAQKLGMPPKHGIEKIGPSRQRIWQLKMKSQCRCSTCGKPSDGKTFSGECSSKITAFSKPAKPATHP
jgi:hypothetical protein